MPARTLRFLMTCAYRAQQLAQRITGRRPFGVHGVVVTPAGEVVLVRLTYAPGWQLPGGGCKRGERAEDGLLRELREEIGLEAWASLQRLGDRRRKGQGEGERGAIFVVRGAAYRPRRSLEIAEVRAFAPAAVPQDVTPWTRVALERAGVRPSPA